MYVRQAKELDAGPYCTLLWQPVATQTEGQVAEGEDLQQLEEDGEGSGLCVFLGDRTTAALFTWQQYNQRAFCSVSFKAVAWVSGLVSRKF